MRGNHFVQALAVVLCVALPASAQFTESLSGFETDREGNALESQTASFNDLKVVIFQDPREADVTFTNIVADDSPDAITNGLGATEESFVANFTDDSFFGANGTTQSLDIRFQWANSNGDRWCLVETFQSPIQGDPSIHLGGKVRFALNFPQFTSEFPTLSYTDRIGVALLVRETGNSFPQGFQDGGEGALEFVGVTSVGLADTLNPIPRPTLFIDGPTVSGDAGWIPIEFDLSTALVVGWTAMGGNGTLDATTNGDMVNRGVLAGLVLTVDSATDSGATATEYVEVLIDEIELEAPVVDPSFPPSIGTPVIEFDTEVTVINVLSSSTDLELEIDRAPAGETFMAEDTVSTNPAGALNVTFDLVAESLDSLAAGDRLRARQTNPSGVSEYSVIIEVNPPAAFSVTLSLDEDGNLGASPADFEFVGAASAPSGAPQGKPVFSMPGVWQQFEFSLIPGEEPVTDFAGGDGQLFPDGGNYNIDALWFTIDPTDPQVGPYEVFIDRVYYIDEDDNEVVISSAEGSNPFPAFRGQTSTTNGLSTTVSSDASLDGQQSNRITWEWENIGLNNTTSVFRPSFVFADSAQAMGFYLYLRDMTTNAVPAPEVPGPIVGATDGVVVNITTVGVTSVELFINGASFANINTTGASSVVFDTSTANLQLGDSVSATQTTAAGTSDLAAPRGVTLPSAPTVQGPLRGFDSTVTVNGVFFAELAEASLVTVIGSNGVLGTAVPTGTSVDVPIPGGLTTGDTVSATQTVNGVESVPSEGQLVLPGGFCTTLFSDAMDSGAAWTVNTSSSDTDHTFGFDYSTLGIPPSPNGGGSTTGLQMKVNLVAPAGTAFVVATPTGLSFSGAYEVRFDFWINANGPFPGGGSGSTEFLNGGVGYDGTTAERNGALLGVTGEGGASRDYRLYKNTGEQFLASGQYAISDNNNFGAEVSAAFPGQAAPALQQANFPQQTGTTNDGCGGFDWHEMVITVDESAGLATFAIDDLTIGTINVNIGTAVPLSGPVQVGYMDIFSSVSDNATLSFGVVDNFRVLGTGLGIGAGAACERCDLDGSGLTTGSDALAIINTGNFGLCTGLDPDCQDLPFAEVPCADVDGSGRITGSDFLTCINTACFGL